MSGWATSFETDSSMSYPLEPYLKIILHFEKDILTSFFICFAPIFSIAVAVPAYGNRPPGRTPLSPPHPSKPWPPGQEIYNTI